MTCQRVTYKRINVRNIVTILGEKSDRNVSILPHPTYRGLSAVSRDLGSERVPRYCGQGAVRWGTLNFVPFQHILISEHLSAYFLSKMSPITVSPDPEPEAIDQLCNHQLILDKDSPHSLIAITCLH